jgi:hypothetical protein
VAPPPARSASAARQGDNLYQCDACSSAFAEAGRRKEAAHRERRARGSAGASGSGSDEDAAPAPAPRVHAAVRSPATRQSLLWELPETLVAPTPSLPVRGKGRGVSV